MNHISRIKELIAILNECRDLYYNKQTSLISDCEYDKLFDELKELESSTGIIYSNSPTQNVGYDVKSELTKVKHSHLMLSLDKTKSIEELSKFANNRDYILSLKLDGLTVLLTYENGELIQAETRGNGEEGELITHNAKVFDNIPLHIDCKERLEVEGEAIITYNDFEEINSTINSSSYKNPRNLVSGSVRQLDNRMASQRHIKFIAWKFVNEKTSFLDGLKRAEELGFDVVPYVYSSNKDIKHLNHLIGELRYTALVKSYPIDGLVMTYNDVAYGESLGQTSHHPKHSIAYKFYDEVAETELIDVVYDVSRNGILTPVAVFKPVEIDGTIVERASVYNISILSKLDLQQGDVITVKKANQIIPKIEENLSANERYKLYQENDTPRLFVVPSTCPVCGEKTELIHDNNAQILVCSNENCKGKLLGKLTHFVSKNAMNIEGLSESTLKKFIELGWINNYIGIYHLKDYRHQIETYIEGFGKRSTEKLLDAIEKSRDTTLERFIYSFGISMIGKSASKVISKYCNGNYDNLLTLFEDAFDWTKLEGIGKIMAQNFDDYWEEWWKEIDTLSKELRFNIPKIQQGKADHNNISGKVFVITGSLNSFKNRDEAVSFIESAGGKVGVTVSTKTSYLVNNDINSTSKKNKKAKNLGVPIITEEQLIKFVNI